MNPTQYKIFPITEAKTYTADGFTYLEGYANTKNVADRYGDVPTVYKARRNFVYDLGEYMKNPVLLIDHVNKIDHVAGSMEFIAEDEKGLRFKARFSNSDHANVKHCRAIYSEGHAKGISIAGQFLHENDAAPEQLTLAKIFEISCVPVPADPNALATAVSKALKDFAATTAAPAVEGAATAAAESAAPAAAAVTEQQKIFACIAQLDNGETLEAAELRTLRTWTEALRAKLFGGNDYINPGEALRIVAAAEAETK